MEKKIKDNKSMLSDAHIHFQTPYLNQEFQLCTTMKYRKIEAIKNSITLSEKEIKIFAIQIVCIPWP